MIKVFPEARRLY